MQKPIVVIDLDGTVLTNHKRLLASAQDVIGPASPFSGEPPADQVLAYIERMIPHSAVPSMSPLGITLSPIQQFYQAFLSDKYLSLDEPIPGALDTIHELSQTFRIVFLTGRHDESIPGGNSMKSETLAWLRVRGFESPEIRFKPTRDLCNTAELLRRDQLFKQEALSNLKHEGRIVAVIGDSVSDIQSAINAGLASLWLQLSDRNVQESTLRSLGATSHPPLILPSWDEVGRITAFLGGDDTQMRPILDMYVSTYTSFLSSLDHITYLCLVTSTVALGFMFNARQVRPMSLLLTSFSVSAVAFLFMAVVSCIFAFLPKTSHPPRAGAWIIFLDLRRLLSHLRGLATDTERTELMDEGMNHDKRAIFINFVEGAYRTSDPTAILCQRYFDLRLANYAKIRWISWGATFLLLGLSCIVGSLLSQLITQFFTTPGLG